MSITNKEKGIKFMDFIEENEIKGTIREYGGKMNMKENNWKQAFTDFFEAFKFYEQAGKERKIICLGYLILANFESFTKINIFDFNELKPYKINFEISDLIELLISFDVNDFYRFEKIIFENKENGNSASIFYDPFIRQYIDKLIIQVLFFFYFFILYFLSLFLFNF